MAFLIQQVDGGRVPGIEYLPCGAITPRIGMALIQSGGNLAVASGTTAPTYVSMIEKETPCTVGDIIPVMRVLPDMMFETTFQAAASSVKLGDKVTLHTDGLQVTATTASGVAEVVGHGRHRRRRQSAGTLPCCGQHHPERRGRLIRRRNHQGKETIIVWHISLLRKGAACRTASSASPRPPSGCSWKSGASPLNRSL